LWASSGQTNYYFTKNKVRAPGDLITLGIENDLYRDIGIEIKKTLSPSEKAKEVGIIQDQFKAKFLAEVESKRRDALALSAAAPDRAPAGGTDVAQNARPGSTPSPSPSPSVEPTPVAVAPQPPLLTEEEIQRLMPKASMADVDIYSALELKPGETMMGEILERYPNGNFKIRVVKRVPYKKGPLRLVSVVGIVKGSDINDETDVINSGKLYEYRVAVAH
jgi:hypothetical protein